MVAANYMFSRGKAGFDQEKSMDSRATARTIIRWEEGSTWGPQCATIPKWT
jgi:hypothetical protein